MATLPIHTVQHIKSVYKKFQVIAVVFTAMTLLAALLAAVSGFQLAKLRKMHPAEVQLPDAPAKEPATADNGMEKKIKALEEQLRSEQTTSKGLRAKVQELEANLAAKKVVTPPPARPTPEKPKAPVKPKVPEVAPATETPPPTQKPGDGKTVAEPLKTSKPSVPAAVSEPAAPAIPRVKSEPPAQVEMPAPHTEIVPSGEPSEQVKSPITPSPAQTAAPTTEESDPPETVPATDPSPDSLPAQPSDSGVSKDGAQQTRSSEKGNTGKASVETTTQPGADSKGESKTE